VADVLAALGFPRVLALVMVSAIADVPSAVVVLTAVDVPGAPAVDKVSAVAAMTTAVDVLLPNVLFVPTFLASLLLLEHLFCNCCFHCSCVPVVGVP
jgi:hypothetical protein